MRVLYVGPYRDGIGYGEACRQYITALDKAGVEVACRPLKFTDRRSPVPDRIAELEKRKFDSYSHLIQHALPWYFARCGEVDVNVGMTYMETSPVPVEWRHMCEQLDGIIACDHEMRDDMRRASIPCEVVPMPCDVNRFAGERKMLPQLQRVKEGGYFLFYTLGELVHRKYLDGLLQAFFAEFHQNEPVKLVVKTSAGTVGKEGIIQQVGQHVHKVRQAMLFPPETDQVVVVGDWLSDGEVLDLHHTCDCFVQVSTGEAWSIPAFDAMAMGRTPIVTDDGGYREFIDEDTGWLVPGRQEHSTGNEPYYPDLFSSRQLWTKPDLLQLRRMLRQAYEDSELRQRKAEAGIQRTSLFSYERAGKRLVEVLEKYGEEKRQRVAGSP